VPPLNNDCWAQVGAKVFNKDSNVILNTDSAAAYSAVKLVGVSEHFTVNHSVKEFSRSIEVIENSETGTLRPSMAGTQPIDGVWRSIKELLPAAGLSVETARGREKMTLYIRAGQWKRMYSTADRWPLFCEAVQSWVSRNSSGKEVLRVTKKLALTDVKSMTKRLPPRPERPPALPYLAGLYQERQAPGSVTCGVHAVNHVL
jgi:hypothetical protein